MILEVEGGCFKSYVKVLVKEGNRIVKGEICGVCVGKSVIGMVDENQTGKEVKNIHKHKGKFEITQIKTESRYIFLELPQIIQ